MTPNVEPAAGAAGDEAEATNNSAKPITAEILAAIEAAMIRSWVIRLDLVQSDADRDVLFDEIKAHGLWDEFKAALEYNRALTLEFLALLRPVMERDESMTTREALRILQRSTDVDLSIWPRRLYEAGIIVDASEILAESVTRS